MQQGDLLMQRKLHHLVERQQQHHDRALKTFSFTDQFVSSPAEAKSDALPDNWSANPNATTGTYFSEERARAQPSPTQNTTGKKLKRGDAPRQTPAERQAMLQNVVKERVLLALEEQKQEDEDRIARCQVQRGVERLKLHQRTRARIELQNNAGQSISERCADTMDLHKTLPIGGKTISGQIKAEQQNEPQRHYVMHNMERMERNLRHREYCREVLKERSSMRRELEDHVGTYHSRQKAKLLGTMGVTETHAAATVPTAEDLHESRVQTAKERLREETENADLNAERKEMSELDDFLWSQRRATKGEKAQRVRELPFSLSAPYHRDSERDASAPPSIKLPNLSGWKRNTIS